MEDPGFWVRANVFYDRSRSLDDLFPVQLHLLDIVFLRRQEEKLAHTSLLLMAMRGAEGDKIKGAFDSYLKVAYPFVNLGDAEEESRKKIQEELEAMSRHALVFQNPVEVARKPLRGPGAKILKESARLKRERKEKAP
tara:strand:- start:2925 stop:3338 length:414 start_codon:yes stop_codon:yes gene_type:complete